jgi:putative acetyltransferase
MVGPAIEADIAPAAAIAAHAYRHDFAGILNAAAIAARDEAFFVGRFAAALSTLRIARRGARVIGFTQVTDTHLDMLFVAAGQRGSGAGTALLRDAEAHGILSLECFRDNPAARRFYQQQGWREVSAYVRHFLGADRAFVRYER